MRKARFTAHQIIAVGLDQSNPTTVKDAHREAGISEATSDALMRLDTAYGSFRILNLEDVNAVDLWSFSLF